MNEIKTITRRKCPKCKKSVSFTGNPEGFVWPGDGSDDWWECYECGYKGSPEYTRFDVVRRDE